MQLKSLIDLEHQGFDGFQTVEYYRNNPKQLPNQMGVYVALFDYVNPLEFLETGSGGFFKGRDPNVPIQQLEQNWVDNESIIYIGKAGGTDLKATLRTRLRQYFAFGAGKAIGHWGGRLTWQINNSHKLIIAYKVLDDGTPSEYESYLISDFESYYNRLPFANLK